MHSPSPVEGLPPELLAGIFIQGLGPYAISNRTADARSQEWLSNICLVSKLWMDVAYSTPELWSLIYVGYNTTSDRLEIPYPRHKVHLYNAKNSLLDVVLDIPVILLPSRLDWPSFWDCWRDIRARGDRWRSFRINQIIISATEELNDLLPPSLPSLREADFSCLSPLTTPFVSAPRLRLLRLGKQGTVPFTSIENLHTLHVAEYVIELHVILQQSPSLHTLEVDQYYFSPSDALLNIHLNSLRQFKASGNINLLGNFLTRLTAPNLELISLVVDGPNPPDHTEAFTDVHFPSLTTIEYESNPTFFVNPLRSFLTTFRDLRTITIKLASPLTLQDIQALEAYNADYRWISHKVARVVWQHMKN